MKGKILGIDYGSKRVGIALSDDMHHYAFAKEVLPNNDTLLEKIAEYTTKEGVDIIVIGESDNPAGGVNTIMRRIEIFKRALEVRTELPVEEVSEAYSSAEARRALETKIKNRKNKTEVVDAAAAAIILQTYLDAQRAKGNEQ
jgi:putative Holliday junction resolvase